MTQLPGKCTTGGDSTASVGRPPVPHSLCTHRRHRQQNRSTGWPINSSCPQVGGARWSYPDGSDLWARGELGPGPVLQKSRSTRNRSPTSARTGTATLSRRRRGTSPARSIPIRAPRGRWVVRRSPTSRTRGRAAGHQRGQRQLRVRITKTVVVLICTEQGVCSAPDSVVLQTAETLTVGDSTCVSREGRNSSHARSDAIRISRGASLT